MNDLGKEISKENDEMIFDFLMLSVRCKRKEVN